MSRLPFPDYLDSTMLNSAKSCSMKFNWSFLRDLHPQGTSIHLTAGAAIAAGLQAARLFYYDPKHPVRGRVHIDELLEAAFPAFCKEWGNADFHEDHQKSFVNSFCALEAYLLEHHPFMESVQPLRSPDGKPRVEFSFAIPLPISHPTTGDPLLYCGRFDLLGEWNGLPCILDEKTTSALGETWRKQWDLRGQFLGYCWACQQLGYPVRNVIVRGIALLKTQYNFLTVPVHYPQYLIDRWYISTLKTVEDLIFTWQNNGYNYNLGDACSAYGGCSYKVLCEANNPEEWVSHFAVSKWNPIARDPLREQKVA